MRSEIPEGETLSREHLANERTFLSWIRTGMNMVGAGILLGVLAGALRFFPAAFPTGWATDGSRNRDLALFGIALVVFGALMELVAAVRFVRYGRSIRRGRLTPTWPVYLLVALGLALMGAACTIYAVVS
ncbi:hypothetical protein Rxycam_00685 [Rubrobacter xylanophilus DSM 9941]|uniref:DUF202 domain-containing protein n=1 Tax=Rubrobacter xylanophilus TaxID=49319 RepID=A0A510HGJ2_9ACTN|nr:DUF202 domain-containing protein [Rubrobacter xylanophilus]QYJ14874.1 hypothetical protein Rxycam_00685 [Rubrobacter xylanophilus DSM 9941]BBL79092.1 hypothetical protein RxyAA322_09460 [Rubrobacter xylanophilus]